MKGCLVAEGEVVLIKQARIFNGRRHFMTTSYHQTFFFLSLSKAFTYR